MGRAEALTAGQVLTAVRGFFGAERDSSAPEWAALDEFTGAPGAWGAHRRADLFVVRAWSGAPRRHERVLVEVKVTRADLHHELAHPEKIAVMAQFAHRVYFATPKGLVVDEDLGPGVGLLEVTGTRARTRIAAKRRRDVAAVPEDFFVEAFRRAGRAEARIRQADEHDAAARIAQLEAQLAQSYSAEQRAREAAERDKKRLSAVLSAIADAGGVACECGQPISARARDLHSRFLRHADGSDCPLNPYGGYAHADLEALALRLAPTIAAVGA